MYYTVVCFVFQETASLIFAGKGEKAGSSSHSQTRFWTAEHNGRAAPPGGSKSCQRKGAERWGGGKVQRGDVDGEVKGDGRGEGREAKTAERGGTRPGRKIETRARKRGGKEGRGADAAPSKIRGRSVCSAHVASGWGGAWSQAKGIIMTVWYCLLKDGVLLRGDDSRQKRKRDDSRGLKLKCTAAES